MNSVGRTGMVEWQAVAEQARAVGPLHLRDLFAADPGRAAEFSLEACGLFADFSKQRITTASRAALVDLARVCGLRERVAAMFSGERINVTENRAVLHVALRAPRGTSIMLDGHDVVPDVHAVLDRMAAFCRRVARED